MLVICIQYYANDRQQAADLCELIAQIEPRRREDVRVRLVARQDCPHLDKAVIDAVGGKFDVSWAKTSKPVVEGWPQGPNAMAIEILSTAPDWLHVNGWTDANGILMLEPDCVVLQKNWLDQILAQWDAAHAAGAWCMGSWRNSGTPWGHVNGNACYRVDFAELTKLHKCPPDYAWDCHAAMLAHKNWQISGLFLNKFREQNATEEALRTPEIGDAPPVLCHGYKDGTSHAIARKMLL